MEIKAKRDELLATLYWTQSIVERRNTMPILGNVLIEAQKGSVRVTATDLEVGVRGSVDAEVVKEGTVTVNAKKIYEIIREVPNEQVQLKRLDNDWVEIRSGKSVFKIVGMDAKEFPQFPKFDAKSLSSTPAATVHEMIERTIFSVSMDETRYSLNGVFVEEGDGGKIRWWRPMVIDWLLKKTRSGLGLSKGVILPRKGLAELKKLLEAGTEGVVSLGFKENMGLVIKDKIELFMRLIDGDFPDYTKVIPKVTQISPSSNMTSCCKRCVGCRFFQASVTKESAWSFPTARFRFRRTIPI